MAVDMFLKIPDCEGESQDKDHLKEIDVLAWSWGLSQSGTTHHGGGGGSGKVNVQDLSFTHYFDAASSVLMQRTFDGKHLENAVLVVRKAGGDAPLDYIVITMTDVMVTSVSTGGSGGEDRLTENVVLNFAEVEVKYQEQKADGSAEAEKLAGWDIAGNVTNV